MWSELKLEILTHKRQFFIDLQAPLLDKIVKLATKYPEPTHDNVDKVNSHLLIDIWAEFESNNTVRVPLFKAVKRLVIGKYEADDFYSQRVDWFIHKLYIAIIRGVWEWPEVDSPTTYWKDPEAKKKLALLRMEKASSAWRV